MARQGTHPPSDDSALTQCPGCSVVFEIEADMLDQPDTRVRCGDCLTVFDARVNRYFENQLDESPVSSEPDSASPANAIANPTSDSGTVVDEPSGVSQNPAHADPAAAPRSNSQEATARSLLLEESDGPAAVRLAPATGSREFSEFDVTYADFDLFSEEADLPEVVFDDSPAPQDENSLEALRGNPYSGARPESSHTHSMPSTRDGSAFDSHVDYDTGSSTDDQHDGDRVHGVSHDTVPDAETGHHNPGGRISGVRKSRLKASGRRTTRAIGNWQFDRNDKPGLTDQPVSPKQPGSTNQPGAIDQNAARSDFTHATNAAIDSGARERTASTPPNDSVTDHRSWVGQTNHPDQIDDGAETGVGQKSFLEPEQARLSALLADGAGSTEAHPAEERAESIAESTAGLTASGIQADTDRTADQRTTEISLDALRAAAIRAEENARIDAQLAEHRRVADARQAELEAAERQRADDLAAQARAAEMADARESEAQAKKIGAAEAARASAVASAAKPQEIDENLAAPWVTELPTDSLDAVFADGDHFEPEFSDDADFGSQNGSTSREGLLTKIVAGIGGVLAFLSGGRWMRSVMIVGLIMVLLGLYMYRERATLVNNSAARPIMASFCWVAGCELAPRFDPAQLKVLQRQIYSHPDKDNTLVINIVMRNDADFNQRYPVLLVNLTDIGGSLVASERFTSPVYLAGLRLQSSKAFPAKTSLQIALEMDDPGSNARSFRLEFR